MTNQPKYNSTTQTTKKKQEISSLFKSCQDKNINEVG
jgi:hypothetical protein